MGAKKMAAVQKEVESFMDKLVKRHPGQLEFHQAVSEVVDSVMGYVLDHQKYVDANILERMSEPDMAISFRVCWEDDEGNIRVNRGWRVQFNNSIGPYKGGMRFHPSVTESVLKFLGFEQVFKNSLTGLPMGGAKGGSNFDPKGKSEREIMRFCHALMIELHPFIGDRVDVPAGDIGVGAREISYMFGKYKRITNRFEGVLTGKGLEFGGSLVRKEATGYGTVYFAENMLNRIGDSMKGKVCVVSGSGNVALHCIEQAISSGAKVVTASDSSGFIYDGDGITKEKLRWLIQLKEKRRGRVSEYAEKYGCEFHAGKRPWGVPCDVAFPCATQNELDGNDARELVKNGVKAVAEGANMPTDLEGIHVFQDARVLYAPGKAANAGGVAVSGLEQSQNSQRISWTRNEVDSRLQDIMYGIHKKCVKYGKSKDGYVDYVRGANIAGFKKVADAMVAYGAV